MSNDNTKIWFTTPSILLKKGIYNTNLANQKYV